MLHIKITLWADETHNDQRVFEGLAHHQITAIAAARELLHPRGLDLGAVSDTGGGFLFGWVYEQGKYTASGRRGEFVVGKLPDVYLDPFVLTEGEE